jgi:hypothetical protein
MNRRNVGLVVGFVALAAPLVVACSAGGAGSPFFFTNDDPSPGTRESPSNTRDAPNGGRGGGGSSSGDPQSSSSGGSGACPANCTGRFTCTSSTGEKSTLTLTTQNGTCAGAGVVLKCDGTLVAATGAGAGTGTWQASGNGFSATFGNETTNCVPKGDDDDPPPVIVDASPPPPQPQPGNGRDGG